MRLTACPVSPFQSTLPVRGGTPTARHPTIGAPPISIHPPRAGRDVGRPRAQALMWYFNPPSPCGEGRCHQFHHRTHFHISIHPPRAGRDSPTVEQQIEQALISIHPPRAGRDAILFSCWMANHISIHPPRAGRDLPTTTLTAQLCDFNPPSPCGEGRGRCCAVDADSDISIHPPRAGRDSGAVGDILAGCFISIHPPRAGRDAEMQETASGFDISIHPPRAGRDRRADKGD